MNNKGYDNYRLIIQEQPNFDLIALVEYYHNGKLVDKKRSANQNFVNKLINQATVDMKKTKMIGSNLVITGKFDGQIVIKNYSEIRNRRNFWELNKKVRKKLPKSELNELTGVKNLKVTRDTDKIKKTKLKKNKFIKPVTLAFIITSQIVLINKLLPEFELPFTKNTESSIETDVEYDDLANMKSVVSTINKNYSFNNSENTKVNILTQKDKIISEVNQKLDSTIEKQDINNSVNPVQNNEMEIADNTDEKVGYESSQYQETKLDEIIEENVSDIIPNAEIINQKEIEPTEAKVEVKRKTEVYEVKEEVIDNKTMNNLSEQPTLPLVTENIEIVTTSLDNDVKDNLTEVVPSQNEKTIDLVEEESIIQPKVLMEENIINEEKVESLESEIDNTEEITTEEMSESTLSTEEPVLAQEFRNSTVEFDNYYRSVVPTYQANSYNDVLTEHEFNQLVAMVQAEAGGTNPQDHYTDALAVTSTVLNRLEDEKWRKTYGDTIMEQIHATDQFLGTKTDTYRQVVNNPEKASLEVVQAVKDCLSGTRNSPYLSFRAKENKAPGRTQFVEGGNNYFGLPKTPEVQMDVEQSNNVTK